MDSSVKRYGTVCVMMGLLTLTKAYPRFQVAIPNGDKVTDPCDPSMLWPGVGHLLPGGAGTRNQFGLDFSAAGLKWSRELCMKDSDGDGRTNGEELGDPECTWTPGSDDKTMATITHPGVCEPMDSPKCKIYNDKFGTLLECAELNKTCPELKSDDIMTQDIRFPKTSIPAEETSYHCMIVDLVADGDFHLVAATPLIDNKDSVHHMILFGCVFPEDYDLTMVNKIKGSTYRCGMTPHQHCQAFLGTWTYGLNVDCYHENAGLRIGTYGIKVVALQVHYNNPRLVEQKTDTSGMTIYYTPKLRPNDASVFLVGQEYLKIPPQSTSTSFGHKCPSECTKEMFAEPVYVTRAVNHMHYLGKSQKMSLYRDGTKLRELTNDRTYFYDSPVFYHFDPPVELLPGDEIVTECTYESDRNTTTYYGAGTSDEMCYGFLTYYPVQRFVHTLCIAWKGVQRCVRKLEKFHGYYGQCKWKEFETNVTTFLTKSFANESCGAYEFTRECNDACVQDATSALQHPCLQGDLGEFLVGRTGTREPFKVLQTCASSMASNSSAHTQTSRDILKLASLWCYVLLVCLFCKR